MNCPQCGTQLEDRAIYCPACAVQARCKQCREELVRDARACMICGALTSPAEASPATQAQNVNRIRFVETDKRRSLDAELSDDAVGLIGQSLGIFVTGQLQGRYGGRNQLHSDGPIIVDQTRLLPGGGLGNGSAILDADHAPGRTSAIPPSGSGDPGLLLSHLDSSAHPEIYAAPRVLEQALHVLRIARDEYNIDGLTASQITGVLKNKFRVSATAQGVYSAFDRLKGVVDRLPAGKGVWKYRLMAAGETFLAEPGQTPAQHTRRRTTRRGTRAKSTVQSAEQQVSEAQAKASAPAGRRASGRPGPKKMLADLISAGYFSSPRVIGEVQAHVDQQRGYQFTTNELAPGFTRLLREGALKRSKREDGQYEYTGG